MNRVINVLLEDEVRKAYLDYAMSVIVGRAIPDIRDGLKPVQRRILFSMHELGLGPDKPFKKTATVVGDVLGKYHPHGDQAIYDALVRMAQDFSLRYTLIRGQGNFGSIDGDPAAAYRYTEAKLAKITDYLLKDIDKDTVNMVPNFDDTRKQPEVLPASFPNILINGSSGIAVGMATNIPPHNISEVIDALIYMIDNEDADIDGILRFIKGPDFPTGGEILGINAIKDAYKKGTGKITLRGSARIEEHKGRDRIIIYEIPYQLNKTQLIKDIVALVKDKRIKDISDVRDESGREGIRIIIDLKRGAQTNVVLKKLFKHTPLQTTYSIRLLAIVGFEPKYLSIKEMLEAFLNFRIEVITKRTEFLLKKAQARMHILEGLLLSLKHIDDVIKIIRGSSSTVIAQKSLSEKYGFSNKQTEAILAMKLQRLVVLEKKKLKDEFDELRKEIDKLKGILNDRRKLLDVIKDELKEINKRFADKRRTIITPSQAQDFSMEDLIKEEEVVIITTEKNYIKRIPVSVYRNQLRGGRGRSSFNLTKEDYVRFINTVSTHDRLLFFTDKGRLYGLKAYDIPDTGIANAGKPIVQFIELKENEKITAVIPLSMSEQGYILMVTDKGKIKKLSTDGFAKIRRTGINIMHLKEERIIYTEFIKKDDDIVVIASDGKGIRFNTALVRSTGRQAGGVRALRLSDNHVVSAVCLDDNEEMLIATRNGYAKRLKMEEIRSFTNRGGKGLRLINIDEKSGNAVDMAGIKKGDELFIITNKGTSIRIDTGDISLLGRYARGVKAINLRADEEVVSITRLRRTDEEGLA